MLIIRSLANPTIPPSTVIRSFSVWRRSFWQNALLCPLQVLRDYALLCDRLLQKWAVDGRKLPSLRTLVKPVLNLFHGEKHGRKWKAMIDQELKTATSLSELFDKSLIVLPDEVLNSRPEDMAQGEIPAFTTEQLPPSVQM